MQLGALLLLTGLFYSLVLTHGPPTLVAASLCAVVLRLFGTRRGWQGRVRVPISERDSEELVSLVGSIEPRLEEAWPRRALATKLAQSCCTVACWSRPRLNKLVCLLVSVIFIMATIVAKICLLKRQLSLAEDVLSLYERIVGDRI